MEPREHTDERGEAPPAPSPEDEALSAASDDRTAVEGPRRRGNRHHTSRRRGRSKGTRARGVADDAARADPARLQAEMPSGRTPGARAADDPGVAPLGTDEEAAGTRPSAAAIEAEVSRAGHGDGRAGLTAEEAMTGRPGHPEESPRGFGKFVTIGAAIVLVLIALFLLF